MSLVGTPRLNHTPVGNFGAIEVGRTVLASHGSNVWLAMHAEPELRLEAALAWFAQVGDVETRVRQLAEFIDAGDEERRGG